MLQPVVRRTWAPEGRTPIHYSWDRRDRMSAISAITVSPHRSRLDLYFDIHDHNIRTNDVEACLCWLRRHFLKGIILALDRLPAHRSAAKHLVARLGRRVEIEWLPPDAPELNPVEQVWSRTKYADWDNFIPEGVDPLGWEVLHSIERTATDQTLPRSFFKHAGLAP